MTSSVRARAPHWNKSARRLAGAAVGPLIVALNDAEGRVQGSAASALGKDRRPHAVEPIVAALKDKNFLLLDVVDSALRPPAVEPLVAALVEPLIAALGDGDVREYVESALAKIKDP